MFWNKKEKKTGEDAGKLFLVFSGYVCNLFERGRRRNEPLAWFSHLDRAIEFVIKYKSECEITDWEHNGLYITNVASSKMVSKTKMNGDFIAAPFSDEFDEYTRAEKIIKEMNSGGN